MTPSTPVRLGKWRYIGRERISADGEQTATIPTAANVVSITAETADVRYVINGAADGNATPIPADQTRILGPVLNLTSLGIFNASSSVAYLEYYEE
jgi:hypothetical protein